jgi:hypothetical protein
METREQWLTSAVKVLTPLVEHVSGQPMPPVRVSVGWPGGRSAKADTIGQCWPTMMAGDKVAQVFIAPTVERERQVLSTLLHEMIHAADDNKSGHRGAFKRWATKAGLVGKMTATIDGPRLRARLEDMILMLGSYPHAPLSKHAAPPKQGTRMLKIQCPECGYTARTTAMWIAKGLPTCPCGMQMIDYEPTPEPTTLF